MRTLSLQVLLSALLTANLSGQQLSPADAKIVALARSHYYNLEAAGFMGMTCAVAFDLPTLPHLSADEEQSRKLLQRTLFSLALDEKGRPTVEHSFPSDSTEVERQRAAPLANLVKSLVGGVFQTWPTKGLQGPIPSFDSNIESVAITDQGYDLRLHVPGAPVHVLIDKNYFVIRIVSAGGKLSEQPSYESTPEGLVFVGNKAVDDSDPTSPVQVSYDLAIASIDSLWIPSSFHLKVNQNVDVRFVLNGCSVKKAQAMKLQPPRKNTD